MNIIIDKYFNIKNSEKISVCIGNFDGFHKGHQELVKSMLNKKEINPSILTFDPDPESFFNKDFKYITNYNEKINLFKKFNLKNIFMIKIDKSFLNLSVDEFINFLKKINVENITIGKDFCFGYKKAGTYKDLKKHFNVTVLEDYVVENQKVSSTLIKKMICENKLLILPKFLGNYYNFYGEVVHGNKIGKTINFPTANINYESHILPPKGVYYCKILIDENKLYNSIVNIGNNPSINYSEKIKLEAYIYDFNEDIYGKRIKITFLEKKREEIRFSDKNQLINQLNSDKIEGERYFKEAKHEINNCNCF